MYFHSEPRSSTPSSVRAPQLTMPRGKLAQAVDAQLVEHAVLEVGQVHFETERRRADRLRCRPALSKRRADESVRAISPAIMPDAPIAS